MKLLERTTDAAQLERWLGKETVERVSREVRGWYGRPIPLMGVPGNVRVGGDGDFVGKITTGKFASAMDIAHARFNRVGRAFQKWSRDQLSTCNSGFPGGLSDLIAAATTSGRRRSFTFYKVGVTGTTGATNSLWAVGNQPAAGANGSAAPGGRAPTSSTTGAIPYANPTAGQTLHIVRGDPVASVINNSLLLYDRIFDVAKTMSSSATEAVTGVPTRYTNTTAGSVDSAEDNFLFMECTSVLAAVAHNWTVCLYTDQAGNTGHTLPSVTGNSSNAAGRLDMPTGAWWAPLASGDTGISALTQMQCSANTVTGAINFVMGHAMALMPCAVANQVCIYDGVTTSFNLQRIFDSACLALLEVTKPSTTATTYAGSVTAVAN